MTRESIIPRPRRLEPAPSLRWGVIGPGSTAGRFVDALRAHGTQQVVAVGSRAAERAASFAARHGIAGTAGSVAQILDLAEVDVVYIATPHDSHRELAERALNAGKHIVVEKPLATTEADARAITSLARDRGLFAMEAMWTRYLPQAEVLRQLLDEHVIGEVTYVCADFGFVAPYDPQHRLFNPALAGGALLDAGVYPVSFIASVLGPPAQVIASGTLAATGVDDHAQLTAVRHRDRGGDDVTPVGPAGPRRRRRNRRSHRDRTAVHPAELVDALGQGHVGTRSGRRPVDR